LFRISKNLPKFCKKGIFNRWGKIPEEAGNEELLERSFQSLFFLQVDKHASVGRIERGRFQQAETLFQTVQSVHVSEMEQKAEGESDFRNLPVYPIQRAV
jgi:hypothetical protein